MTPFSEVLPASIFFLFHLISFLSSTLSDTTTNNIYNNNKDMRNINVINSRNKKMSTNRNKIKEMQQDQPMYKNKDTSCSYPCALPCPELDCPDGVNQVTDGCGCCAMCARQQGDLCTQSEKCDDQKSLYCDMNIDGGNRGICRAKNARSCNISSRVINDGSSLDLNCSIKCYCQDGRYACTTLCPQELRSPSPTHCKDAQLVAIKNRCCKEWVCPHPHNLINPDDSLASNQYLNNDRGCNKQDAKWSACDKKCGYGESIRLSNNNANCQTIKEVRICYVRPCGMTPDLSAEAVRGTSKHNNTGKKKSCRATVEASKPMKIEHAGCVSIALHQLKYCTQCKRCCGPEVEETHDIEMVCKDGKVTKKKFMFIEKCSCVRLNNQTCPFT